MTRGGRAPLLGLCAAAVLGGCGGDAGGEAWEAIAQGDGQMSVAPERVVPLGNQRYPLWLRDQLGEPQVDADGRRYHAFVLRVEFDCGRRLARELVGEIPQTMLDETHTHAQFAVDEPWKPVASEPRTAEALAGFCEYARRNGL